MGETVSPVGSGLMSVKIITSNTTPSAASAASVSYLRQVRDGLLVSREAAVELLHCGPEVMPELLRTARHLKEQYRPAVITYSRKVFLPLTNLCRDYCGYCTYRRDPGDAGAHTMSPEEVLEVARQGEKLGC